MSRVRSLSILACLGIAAVLGRTAEPKKLPVPDADDQRKAQTDIRTLYKADYAKKTAADLQRLAAKLVQLALETKGDATARFVLLSEAREVAGKAADPGLAIKAVALQASEFQVDEIALKAKALEVAGAAATVPACHRAVTTISLAVTDEAVRLDRFPEAARLASLAYRSAAKTKDAGLAKKASARESEIREIAVNFELLKPAEARLKVDPKDDAAARSVGRFRCLLKGDWESGLPLLAQGAQGVLKDLAKQDLASPKTGEERRALADAYWEFAGQEKGTQALQLKRRACHYYRLALPELGGLALDRTKRRLEEYDPPGPWDHLDIGAAEQIDEFIRMPAGEIHTKQSFSGPIEIRLVVRIPANDIRLHGPSGSCVIFNWGDNPSELRLTRPDGQSDKWESGSLMRSPVKPLKLDTWASIRWKLTASEFSVWIDDKPVFSEKGKYTLTEKAPIRLSTIPNGVEVKTLSVKAVK